MLNFDLTFNNSSNITNSVPLAHIPQEPPKETLNPQLEKESLYPPSEKDSVKKNTKTPQKINGVAKEIKEKKRKLVAKERKKETKPQKENKPSEYYPPVDVKEIDESILAEAIAIANTEEDKQDHKLKGFLNPKTCGTTVYSSRHQNLNFDDVKAPGLNDRKSVNINNMNRLAIVQPRELSYCPNSNFDAGWSINKVEAQKDTITRWSALYHAYKQLEQKYGETLRHLSPSYKEYQDILNKYEKYQIICQKYETQIKNLINKIKNKSEEQSQPEQKEESFLQLKTISPTSSIPKNHNNKFICSINLKDDNKTSLKQHKVEKNNLTWANNNKEQYENIKNIKNLLKINLAIQIKKTLENNDTYSEMSLEEIELSTQVKDFEFLMGKVLSLPEKNGEKASDNLQDAIDEVCDLTERHIGKKDVLHKKCIDNFYYKSTEYMVKNSCSITIEDPNMKQKLITYLNEVIPSLKIKLKKEQCREKKLKTTIASFLTPQSSQETYDYVQNHISVHKKLSYSRFVTLFQIHSRFINRINQAISLIEDDKERQKAIDFITKAISPENLLQETSTHRHYQGRHLKNENHDKTRTDEKTIDSFIKLVTLSSPHNFIKFECAHVVPAPGLFIRRGGTSSIDKHHVNLSYFELNDHDREEMVMSDIKLIHKKYENNIPEYTNHILDLVLRLTSEECATTIHLPSFFNQEIDGVSEKYIEFKLVDVKTQEIYLKFKDRNFEIKENETEIHYTSKLYKYMQVNAIQEMMSKSKTFNYVEVLDVETNYLIATKHTIAIKINELVQKEISIPNIITAFALLNVFKAVKNAEAKAGKDMEENDKDISDALEGLAKKWTLQST